MHELQQCLLSKTRYGLDKPRWWAQQTFYYKDNIHLLENGNKKLALSIKTKLDNIRINCHEIAINEKLVPTIKAVDYQGADYWRAIATLSRNRQ